MPRKARLTEFERAVFLSELDRVSLLARVREAEEMLLRPKPGRKRGRQQYDTEERLARDMVKWLEVQNLRHKNPRLSVTAAATEVSARGGISVSSLRSAYKTIEGYRRTRPAFRRKFDGYVRLLFSM